MIDAVGMIRRRHGVATKHRRQRSSVAGVKAALLHGLQEIFLWSAVIMTASILLHLVLKREPLRVRAPVDAPGPAAAPAH